ncbi:DNA replication/repair protein RecF [Brevibacterium sp. 5221]|uniref:DNA replication and repair protein RecF n=1 Tax=Brevibacterium rongguiense TaxID=2695267 RepID=A0A6N9H9H6_9MICO|nr:DNA replication/repair protein RecF [Brevibacterium rongguiense]MYM20174.1 DNA replication/repair protein RecF [Brevibacterium rongguiense]
MWVSRLSLRDFRSYALLDLELEPGVTAFAAPNGWGKTNLVESLGYLSSLSSHRVSQDLPLVRAGREQATVSALAHRGRRQVTLEVTVRARGANTARINRQGVRTRELLGLLPCVVFAPEDLGLVKGEPAERRAYLDALLVTGAPRYAAVISDFDRALRQRNALLKSLRAQPDESLEATLEIWDRAFAQAAAQLVLGRRALLERLAAPLSADFAVLAAGAKEERRSAQAVYASRIDYAGVADAAAAEEVIVDALARRRRPEIERGLTLVGPQRDDVELTIGGVPAKGYASHGESWSLALGLRLAGWRVLTGDSDDPAEQPVLVLDDVFAELDAARRERLAELVAPAEQVLITAAVAGDIPANLSGRVVDLDELTAARGEDGDG